MPTRATYLYTSAFSSKGSDRMTSGAILHIPAVAGHRALGGVTVLGLLK